MLATALCLLLPAAPVQAPADPLLVVAGRLVVVPGEVHEPGYLLADGGKVSYAGPQRPGSLPQGTRVLEFPDATLVPGFVDAHSHAGAYEDLVEVVSAFTPVLKASEALDPFSREVQALRSSGTTSFLLAPRNDNVAGGHACLVKVGERARPALSGVVLKMCLDGDALDQNRHPTSRMGAVELARASSPAARLKLARGGNPVGFGADDISGLFPSLAREVPIAVSVRSSSAILGAMDLAEDFGLRLALLHADEAGIVLPEIEAAGVGVILGPLTFSSRLRDLELPARLASQRIRFAFASDAPSAGGAVSLRLSAALAVRHGCSREVALAALTTAAADLLGVSSRVGSLRVGRDADFAVFSEDPLDLSSRVLAVFVEGREIFSSDEVDR